MAEEDSPVLWSLEAALQPSPLLDFLSFPPIPLHYPSPNSPLSLVPPSPPPPSPLLSSLWFINSTIPAYHQEDIPSPQYTSDNPTPVLTPRSLGPFPSQPCPDFELPAMVTSDDFWEAAYRREQRARKEHSCSPLSSRNGSRRGERSTEEGEDNSPTAGAASALPPISSAPSSSSSCPSQTQATKGSGSGSGSGKEGAGVVPDGTVEGQKVERVESITMTIL